MKRKPVRYIVVLIGIVAVAYLAASGKPVVEEIDSSFYGISSSLENQKTVHLLVIHGIGSHCVGYSETLIKHTLAQIKLFPDKDRESPDWVNTYSATDCWRQGDPSNEASMNEYERVKKGIAICRQIHKDNTNKNTENCEIIRWPNKSNFPNLPPEAGFIRNT